LAWNEPDDNDRDPWGRRRGHQGPPDLDEVVRKMQERLGSLFGRRPGGGRARQDNTGAIVSVLVVGIAVWLSYDMFYRIDQAELGVVRRFGSYVTTLQPGLHLRLPRPIEYVAKENVDRIRDFTVDATMLTEDENIVDVEVATQYRVKDVTKFLFNITDPDETVRQLTESSIREIIGTNTLDFVITQGRGEIAVRAQERIQSVMDAYDAGIEITSVNMQPAKPPEQVKAAFDDAIKAREDEQRKVNEAEAYRNEVVQTAQGEADRMRLEAQAYREQVIANAEGEASRFEQILSEYQKAPEITRQRLYLETIESVLRDTSKVMLDAQQTNNLVYLPLDKIIERASGGSRTARSFTPDSTVTAPNPNARNTLPDARSREVR
jgi:membrane protease subunit HflK